MIYQLNEIKLPLDYSADQVLNEVKRFSGLNADQILNVRVERRSLDARKKPCYNLTILFSCPEGITPDKSQLIKPCSAPEKQITLKFKPGHLKTRPLVIGAGPAGLMSALILADHGLQPLVLEQGSEAKTRAGQIDTYLKIGKLNIKSNILFGEGGAGLFSDGKLTSRHKDRQTMKLFFETLVRCGAPPDILIDAEPHLGSDLLLRIVPRLRELIEKKGGELRYEEVVTGVAADNKSISGIMLEGEVIESEYCILATGHSARDVYQFLADADIALEQKPFALGVRLEIPQDIINRSQYGQHYQLPQLGAASFRLTRKPDKRHRACYTFCMCPGGEVVPCASSAGMLTSNGMSWSKRSGIHANSAFLVPVEKSDFKIYETEKYPMLAGSKLQAEIEKSVFTAGGGDYSLPASRLSDFLNRETSLTINSSTSCKRVNPGSVYNVLPSYISETLCQAIPRMLSRFGKLNFDEITVYGAETRSSSPIRITRDKESMMSVNMRGLFPCGEGSGYAGGIVSSAIDGIKAAEALLKIYHS